MYGINTLDPKHTLFLFDTDDSSGGGGGEDTPPKSPEKEGDGDGEKDKGKDEKTFTQSELETIVKDRLDRERRKAEKESEKKKETEKAERLKEQEKFKELSETQAAQIADLTAQNESITTELEDLKAIHTKYEKAIKAHLETQREGLPDHVLALLDKLDPVDQLEYIANNADALKIKPKGLPKTPDASDDGELSAEEKERLQKQSDQFYARAF